MAKSTRKKRKRRHRRPRGFAAQSAERARLDTLLEQAQTLYDADQAAEALQLLESNLNRFDQFAPLHAALATLYGTAGRFDEAATQASIALDLDPRQADYYLVAAIAYMSAGYYSFAFRARRQWLRSAPHGPSLEKMRQLDAGYRLQAEEIRDRYHLRNVQVAEEAGYQLDKGHWALRRNMWADALRYSQAASKLIPGWPSPRNNISTALFYMGRHDEAIAGAEAVLRECDPDNIHALANLIRYHTLTGNAERANEYGDRLAALPLASGLDDVFKQVEGLSVLDRDADIERILSEAEQAFGDLPAEARLHQGIVAANRGQREKALAYLSQAQQAGRQLMLLQDTLEALEQNLPGLGISSHFPHTHYSNFITRDAFDQIPKLIQRDEESGRRDERAWTKLLRRYPQLPFVARKMLYEASEAPSTPTVMLELLGHLRTPAALETLREFATGQVGEQKDRIQALHVLQKAGGLPSDAEVEIWVNGQRQVVQPMLQEISDEFTPDYPEEAWDLYGEALTAQQAGRMADAERAYEAMLKIAPDAKEAYNNLALIYMQRDETARANEYIDKALEIDPLYPFPRTARALQALEQDGVEAAREWLKPLLTVRQWHPLGFVVFHKAMARVAIAEHDYEQAREYLEMAKQFREDDPDIQLLLDRLDRLDRLGDMGNWFRENDTRYRQRRQRAKLPADPTLADCFGLLTKGDMTGIRKTLGIHGVSGYKKAELKRYLIERMNDANFIARVIGSLNDAERTALRDVLDHGGVMDWQAFARVHGDDLDERPYLEYHAINRETVMGRLRARGLLFEGTAGGQLIIAIPRELRPLVRQALEATT